MGDLHLIKEKQAPSPLQGELPAWGTLWLGQSPCTISASSNATTAGTLCPCGITLPPDRDGVLGTGGSLSHDDIGAPDHGQAPALLLVCLLN